LIRARLIGLSRKTFWDLTFRELIQEFVVAKRKAWDQHDSDMTNAWTVAALIRQEKLPELERLLTRPMIRKQTRLEQQAAMRQMANLLGKPLKRVRLIRRDIDGQ